MHESLGKMEYRRQLKWVLDFLNLNILNLPAGGFLNLLHGFLDFFYQRDIGDADIRMLLFDSDRNRESLAEVQNFIKAFVDNTLRLSLLSLEKGEEFPVSGYSLDVSYTVDVDGSRVLLHPQSMMRAALGRINLATFVPMNARLHYDFDDDYFSKKGIDKVKALVFSGFVLVDYKSAILLKLVPLLGMFRLDRIMKCPECQQYFIATEKKKSPLCPRCVKKESTYKWRDKKENREALNEYSRNLQKGVADEGPAKIRDRKREEKEK